MRLMLSMVFAGLCLTAQAALADNKITVNVLSNQGLTLADVVVSIKADPNNPVQPKASQAQSAIMKQIDQQFVPHILVVQQGATVSFPNTDTVKHHVYSFSPAKTFEISLQEQLDEHPIQFGESGIVELGCNIHDWMLGYIYVSEGDLSGKTNKAGAFQVSLPDGNYTVDIWHPRFDKPEITKQHTFTVSASAQTFTLQLSTDLLESFSEFDEIEGLDVYE
ncbi:methylamine utilization protein [Glaciecola sp. XM2]|uniref:methylamine utilization protein n=1 Tax=Glaciecola sp. XM2 TaxID=1914931 RepID=UPI001BDE0797|nr:methylamine utilization protein [Glaciecola sp. XM2]MBT1450208.1 methylamine utilization protein [Glaciecola sp. XM2]